MLRKLALLTFAVSFAALGTWSIDSASQKPPYVPGLVYLDATEEAMDIGEYRTPYEWSRAETDSTPVDVQWLRDRFGEPEYKLSNKRPLWTLRMDQKSHPVYIGVNDDGSITSWQSAVIMHEPTRGAILTRIRAGWEMGR